MPRCDVIVLRGQIEAGLGSIRPDDSIDVVGIPRNVRNEEVAGVVGGRQTADTLGALGIAEVAGIFDAGAVAQASVGAP